MTTRHVNSGSFHSIGAKAAEIAANVRFRRRVINLCRRPRLVVELLAHLGAERSITTRIDQLLEEFENLDPEALERIRALPREQQFKTLAEIYVASKRARLTVAHTRQRLMMSSP